MNTFSIQSLQQFISANQLKRVKGIILFDAEVRFYSGNALHTIISPVQIIVLPNDIAIYILEFLKEEYNTTEMYSTGQYYFTCPHPKALEIYQINKEGSLLISILPIQ